MEARVNYAAVGAFVVALAVAAIAGVLWLTTGLTRTQYNQYLAYVTESVSGLNVGAPVKYRGVDVGFVREIGLRPGNPEEVRLLMEIERGTPVKEDTIAILSVQGLTGIAFIDLTGGTAGAAMLMATPGEEYPVIETGPSLLARLDEAASKMFTNIERLTDSLYGFLDEDTQEDFRATLSNIRTVTARLEQVLTDENAEKMGETVDAVHTVAMTLSRNNQDLESILNDMAAATARFPGVMERVDHLTGTLEEAGGDFSETMRVTRGEVRNLSQHVAPQASEVLLELRSAASSLQRFVDELEGDPALLLHGRRDRRLGPGESR
jgi:phospholipid/cholesterol/gamma-HCH transport system substrate-binding protein